MTDKVFFFFFFFFFFFLSYLLDASPIKCFWSYCKSRSVKFPTPDTINHNNISGSIVLLRLLIFYATVLLNASILPTFLTLPFLSMKFLQTYLFAVTLSSSFICKLKNNSADGIDGITNIMLKRTLATVSPILCDIFNLSLSTGQIPEAWNLSRVTPIFKSGDPLSASNYRPISPQPICCKLLKKVVHGQVLLYLFVNNILTDRQFSFLPRSSITDALIT